MIKSSYVSVVWLIMLLSSWFSFFISMWIAKIENNWYGWLWFAIFWFVVFILTAFIRGTKEVIESQEDE